MRKQSDSKDYMLYDSTCMKSQNYSNSRVVVTKGRQEFFGGDRNVLCHDYSVGYTPLKV